MTDQTIKMSVTRLKSLTPAARASFLAGLKIAEVIEFCTAVSDEPKPRTPRPVLEKRILGALAEAVAIEERAAKVEPDAEADADASDEGEPDEGEPTDEPTDEQAPRTAAPPVAAPVNPRMPPVGTVLRRIDRHGTVRCEATVTEAGVRYQGKFYKSLSASALAASKHLGLQATTQDGYMFWQLKKLARPTVSARTPAEVLDSAWQRYRERAEALVKAATNETRAGIRAAIEPHAVALAALLGKVG